MGMVEEIKSYILSSALGGNPWIDPDVNSITGNIFADFFPPSAPDRAASVHQIPGSAPQRGLGNTIMWENPRLRIRTRAAVNDFAEAKLDSEKIRDLFNTVTNQLVSGTFYLSVRTAAEPAAEALDPSNRPVFYTEYDIMKYPSE